MQRPKGLGSLLALFSVLVASRGAAQTVIAPIAPATSHFELGLHARSMRATSRAEQLMWVTLTVPLERVAAPGPVPLAAAPAKTTPLESPPPDASFEPRGAELQLSIEQLRAFADFSRRAVGVALSVAGVGKARSRLDSLAARAKSSALLPELRLRVVRNTDQALRWVPTTDDPYRVTQADGAGLILEASALFRLDRLVFAHEELAVERLRQRAAEETLKVEARVEQALLELLRARQLACALDPNDASRTTPLLKLVELVALLDTLTAGWFGAEAPSLGRAVWGFPEAVLGQCRPPEAPARSPATIPVASLDDSE